MSYEVPYKVTVNVPGLIDADGVDLTAEKAALALEALAAELRAEPQTLKHVFKDYGLAEAEDRWVMRSISESNRIQKANGDWITVASDNIDPADTFTSAEAAKMGEVGVDVIWSKPEDIYGTPVLATIKDDLFIVVFKADISEWLAKAGAASVAELVKDDWGFGYGADAIYYALEAQKHPSALRLSNYLAARPQSPTREMVGFSVYVDEEEQAKEFLKEVSPQVFDEVFAVPSYMDDEP